MWAASPGLLLASRYVQPMTDQQEMREWAEREVTASAHHLLFQVGSGRIHPTKAAMRWATLSCAAALAGLPMPLPCMPGEGGVTANPWVPPHPLLILLVLPFLTSSITNTPVYKNAFSGFCHYCYSSNTINY